MKGASRGYSGGMSGFCAEREQRSGDGRKERIGKTLYIGNELIKKKDIGGVRGRKRQGT